MRENRILLLLLFVAVCALCLPAAAQLPTATVNGTVTDPAGAAVAGAKVTLTNQATGVKRETSTGDAGQYVLTGIPAGDYTLRIESGGFTPQEQKVRLEVGVARTVDAKLALAKLGQQITVTEAAAGVELTQSTVQGLVTSATVENIPLNGRNFLELSFLIPGNRPATNFDPTKTNTLEVSSAGAFGRGGNISVDGGDNNDEVVGGTLANFPEDGVAEYQIATNRFTAEVGRSGSSIINIITKSGTNEYHGSAFFFVRNRNLQGLPATSLPGSAAPPFDRQHYGGSVGGFIQKDRAWWFFSFENRHQNAAVQTGTRNFTTNTVDVTSAAAPLRDRLLTTRVDYKLSASDTIFGRYSFNRSTETANGSLRRPIGTAANRQNSFNRFNSVLADWTHTFSATIANTLTFHYDKFLNNIPAFSPDDPITVPTGLATGNEIRFPSLQDGANFRIPQSTKFDRYQIRDMLSWVLGRHTLRFGGEWQHLSTFALFDLFGSGTAFTTEDFASRVRSGHAGPPDDRDIPIAVALRSAAPSRPPIVPFYPNIYFGTYVQDDWKARPNLTVNLGLRWEYDDVLGDSSNLRPCPTLTTVDNTCEFIENIVGTHKGPNLTSFGPRLGFAWDPWKRGKTVVRGGYGIYYDRIVTEVPLLELLLNGRILPLAAFNGSTLDASGNFAPDPATGQIVSLANPFGGGRAVFGIGINHIPRDAKRPYVQQFTLGVQQQVATNWLISADGIHDFGQRFLLGRLLRSTTSTSPLISCTNGVDPCTVTDPLTGRSDNVTNIESAAKSWYDALLVSLQKRPTKFEMFGQQWGWGFNLNYTLSKTFNFSNDDQIPFNGAEDQVDLIERTSNLRLEKGYAPTDERHRGVFYGVFDVPWKITISPIWTISSRVPMDSLVPALSARLPILPRNALGRDIRNGAQLNAAIDLWNSLPACTVALPSPSPCHAGAMLAHVNPNVKFGRDFNSLDLRVTKTFTFFNERQKVQFITEAFNLFNVVNIRGFNNNNFSGFNNDITSSSFNRALRTAGGFFGSGGPRAFQFALRYSF